MTERERTLVERLRAQQAYTVQGMITLPICAKAADCIDIQAAEITSLRQQVEALTKERDEARAGRNHHRRKSDAVKIARNRMNQGMEHWKDRAIAAERRLAEVRADEQRMRDVVLNAAYALGTTLSGDYAVKPGCDDAIDRLQEFANEFDPATSAIRHQDGSK